MVRQRKRKTRDRLLDEIPPNQKNVGVSTEFLIEDVQMACTQLLAVLNAAAAIHKGNVNARLYRCSREDTIDTPENTL